jgi:hypothetical protein
MGRNHAYIDLQKRGGSGGEDVEAGQGGLKLVYVYAAMLALRVLQGRVLSTILLSTPTRI